MSSPTPVQPLGQFVDALGTRHARASGEVRIVSLVPSLTELLCDLGLAPLIVGRTGFCMHPREFVKAIPKVGGTKDVKIDKVRALHPTHLVVNIDENEKPTVEKLARFVPQVIVTHPLEPMDNIGLYRLLGGIFGRNQEADSLCTLFLAARDELESAAKNWPRERVLYLIWKAPWMTVSRDTYISRTLGLAHWDTVPVQASVRYPKLSLTPELIDEIDRVLLSSEPYSFGERHVQELRALCPGRVCIHLVDGAMISWYGSRAIAGLRYLKALRTRSPMA
jgi:ABC-type Fe3+-hydroxamate transport system substrate-binding protein